MTESVLVISTSEKVSVIMIPQVFSSAVPLWSHSISGRGNPLALQFNTSSSVLVTLISAGSSVKTGMTRKEEIIHEMVHKVGGF